MKNIFAVALVVLTAIQVLCNAVRGGWVSNFQEKSIMGMHGSKLGWSCGPSLPELLADHQIVLCGGPVVYWKLLTINFDNILIMCTILL